MEKLNEIEIAQSYIGKTCDLERYSAIFNKANILYCGHCDNRLKWEFGITPALYLGWDRHGIDFKIRVSLSDGAISHCTIIKYKDNNSGLYVRASAKELKPTQQELRIFKKILEYITI